MLMPKHQEVFSTLAVSTNYLHISRVMPKSGSSTLSTRSTIVRKRTASLSGLDVSRPVLVLHSASRDGGVQLVKPTAAKL